MDSPEHLCHYGCGKPGIFQFKNGNWCCSKKPSTCLKIKNKISYGVKNPKKIKIEKPDFCFYECGNPAIFYMKSINKWCCSKSHNSCPSQRSINSKSNIGKLCPSKGRPGRKQSAEHKRKLGISKIGDKNPAKRLDVRNKISKTVKNLWDDLSSVYYTEEYWKKRYNGSLVSPNVPEKFITKILEELFPGKYKFVGNGKFWIKKKNPDWINNKNKKVIEFFGEWWHGEEHRKNIYNDSSTNEDHEKQRINHYLNNDYKCLVVWEYELKDLAKLNKKIIKFEKGE